MVRSFRLIGRFFYQPVALALFSLAILGIYFSAEPGHFLFDDVPSLRPLKEVTNYSSALDFIFTGEAGPLGRPLALLTFALQANAWPENPAAMLRVNILIHLLSIWACFALSLGLIRVRLSLSPARSFWVAFAVSALWGLSPFLATTHLMIIQRMTGLAGLFTLSGLAAFVWAHVLVHQHLKLARGLLFVVPLAMVLGVLSKETAVLLPVLALITLKFWIPVNVRMWGRFNKGLMGLIIVIPSLVVFLYLAIEFVTVLQHGYGPMRDFTPMQRLMSQPPIMLDYVRQLFIPQAFSVSPFMDRIPAPKGWFDPPLTLIAPCLWSAALVWAIRIRKSQPVILYGLVFFLVGHFLESSFIGLELYFAHRNYVPSFGLYFALIVGLTSLPERYETVIKVGLVIYMALFAVVLAQVTSAWSQTHVSARIWLEKNPYSERATQVLANQFIQEGDIAGARATFDQLVALDPRLAMIQVQRTQFCSEDQADFDRLMHEVRESLKVAKLQPFAATELFRSAMGEPSPYCKSRDVKALADMADALLMNPVYVETPQAKAYLLGAKAIGQEKQGSTVTAIDLFEEAFRVYPALDFITYAAILMANSNQYDRAYSAINNALTHAPNNPFKRRHWSQQLNELRSGLDASRQVKDNLN
jgi:protein O-mannosyl-transferase